MIGPGHEGAQGGVAGERHVAGDGLHRHQGQRVDVGAPVERGALQLFGGGVPGRTEHGPEGLGPARLGQRPGNTEIGHADLALLVEEQVRRLDVAVDQASGMGIGQGRGDVEASAATCETLRR